GNRGAQAGYAMAALLVAMTIMAVMMAVAMPVWKQASQREKEEELVFRGTQYVHAIGLFKRKFANASPPNIDVLVDQRFLRSHYNEWAFVFTQQVQQPGVGGVGAPGVPGQRGQPQGAPGGSAFPPNGRGRGFGRGDPNSPPGSRGSRGFNGSPDNRVTPITP